MHCSPCSKKGGFRGLGGGFKGFMVYLVFRVQGFRILGF